MDESRINQLTSREVEFLRLFAEPMLIKEIAFRCGVADVTVNKALESARKKLNVRSSREAARLVAERDAYRKAIGQPQRLGGAPESAILGTSDEDREWQPPRRGEVVREEQRAYVADLSPGRRKWSAILAFGGERHDLTLRQRAMLIIIFAVAIIVAAGTLVTIGRGVSHSVAAAVRALS